MTDLYNLTILEEATNPYELVNGINTLSNNLLGIVILAFISIIVMIIFRGREPDFSNVLLGTFFISSIVGVLLWAINWLDVSIVAIPIILLAGTVFYKLWQG